jgi:hypothetical protein
MRWQVGDVTVTKVPEVEMHWPFSALLPEVTEEVIDAIRGCGRTSSTSGAA